MTAWANTIGGFALGGFNQTSAVVAAWFNWEGSIKVLNISIINSASIVGYMVGSLCASAVIKSGRRKAAFLANTICIIGCLPCLILNFWTILVGRFLIGLASRLLIVVCSVYMKETVPAS